MSFSELRYTLRGFGRTPGFAATAILCLGLGIGATTSIYSVVHAVLLRPLPFAAPERIVVLRATNQERGIDNAPPSLADFVDWRAEARSFEHLAAYDWRQADLVKEGRAERLRGLRVTREYFDLLGIEPYLGRVFTREDLERDEPTLVLGKGAWERQFGGDESLVGKTVGLHTWYRLGELGPVPFTVIGIPNEEVRFLPTMAWFQNRGAGVDDRVAFWMPLPLRGARLRERATRFGGLEVVGRLKVGVALSEARAEMRAIADQLQQAYPETNRGWSVSVIPLSRYVQGDVRPAFLALLSAVAFLLLIACANVAGMILLRANARESELAVRRALGASKGVLMRQPWLEAALLSVGGGIVGLAVAGWGVRIFRGLAPPEIPRLGEVSIDGAVLGFALVAASVTAIVVGLIPAWRVSFPGSSSLRQVARGTSNPSRLFSEFLVIAAMALSLVLLVSASLMMKSFLTLRRVNPGFAAENVLTMKISLPAGMYEWRYNSTFTNEVLDQVRALPGVVEVGAVMGLPMTQQQIPSVIIPEGESVDESGFPRAHIRVVSDGYFDAMSVRLVEGRFFTSSDSVGDIGSSRGAIINESMARRFWADETALGKRFKTVAAGEWIEVIGVVGDVRYSGLREEVGFDVYFPERLFPQPEISLVVRSARDPRSLGAVLRDTVHALEPSAFVTDIVRMEELVARSVAKERLSLALLFAFSVTALCLVAIGTYGLVSSAVSRRQREIGIRMALGARVESVTLLLMKRGLAAMVAGVAIGTAGSLAFTRVLSSQLHAVEPTDGTALFAGAMLLVMVVVLASYVSAHRVTRTDPVSVLRHE